MANSTAKKLMEQYGPTRKKPEYHEPKEPQKHSVRTEHTGKFRPKDGGSNGGYDRK